MLKKLRLKFILVNMTIVTVMLGIIFGLLYYSTSRNLEQESLRMMENVAMNPRQTAPPGIPRREVRLPYFCVLVDRAGETAEAGGEFLDLSDEELLNTLLQRAYDAQSPSGVLKDCGLRFFRRETPMGTCIVFADITSELSTLKNLLKTFAATGSAAFLAFLGITVLLARWAVKPVEDAWQQQKQFVADASHELKTPLTVILTDAELLHAPECPETDRQQLSGSIITMSRQMRGLVERLLELARIDNSRVEEAFRRVSASEVLTAAAMMFEPVFFEKELPFVYEVEPDLFVNGNEDHLKQLADILLDNAGKYASPGGKIFLRLKRVQHRHCLLEVSDQGEPIGSEDLKHLFKRFYRADKARTMNHSYGLGLSIAQKIVEEHHGRIWAESRDGYNRFFAELPLL